MKHIAEKLTKYVVKASAVSEEYYAIYQYGFQIGLEMLCCFIACLSIGVYLQMIPEFIVYTGTFILLRTYAGGIHLNSFASCFVCSVMVQTFAFLINRMYKLLLMGAWVVIVVSNLFIWKFAPVENINRELDSEEKIHCKKRTMKIIIGILIGAVFFTFRGKEEMVSIIALTVFIVLISQWMGIWKYKIEKNKNHRAYD